MDRVRIDIAKRIPLPFILRELGIECPNRKTVIHSPIREDREKSFSIFENKGAWYWTDHGTGEHGSAIDIVMKLRGLDFESALNFLLSLNHVESAYPRLILKSQKENQGKIIFMDDNGEARRYLIGRGISEEVIENVEFNTVEIVNGKYRNRYIAFPTPNGHTCRAIDNNPVRCRFIGPAGLWIHGDQTAEDVYVFESVIDALSWLTIFPKPTRPLKYISLNSVSLSFRLQENGRLWLFLDKDNAGDAATRKITEVFPDSTDCRIDFLQGCKDLNDFLTTKYLPAEMK